MLLILTFAFSLAACGGSQEPSAEGALEGAVIIDGVGNGLSVDGSYC